MNMPFSNVRFCCFSGKEYQMSLNWSGKTVHGKELLFTGQKVQLTTFQSWPNSDQLILHHRVSLIIYIYKTWKKNILRVFRVCGLLCLSSQRLHHEDPQPNPLDIHCLHFHLIIPSSVTYCFDSAFLCLYTGKVPAFLVDCSVTAHQKGAYALINPAGEQCRGWGDCQQRGMLNPMTVREMSKCFNQLEVNQTIPFAIAFLQTDLVLSHLLLIMTFEGERFLEWPCMTSGSNFTVRDLLCGHPVSTICL